MKPSFLYGLIGGFNWLPMVVGLAMLIAGIFFSHGENKAGAPLIWGLGLLIVFLMVFNAWKKSR